ncbi:MAG: 23S rRNA (guanosine(2251)-2'-O)-methyltransferase RlmB [Flavobacteriales bacterium]
MHRPFHSKRPAQGMIIGFRAVLEAIESGKELDKVLVQKGLQGELSKELRTALHHADIPFQLVPAEKLNQLSRANHQGVIAFLSQISFGRLDEIIQQCFEQGRDPRIVILDHITDVRNFGAICRSAECFGAHAVVIPEKGAAQINSEAIKTSAGALLSIPVCREKNLSETIRRMQQSGLRVAACTEKGAVPLRNAKLTGPMCVVLGAEDTGISNDILRLADELVVIPMTGTTSSLNVSVAAGILLYELATQSLN